MKSPNLRPVRAVSKTRLVFRKSKRVSTVGIGRQILEGVLLLALGTGMMAFLSWLPQRFDAMVVVSEAIADLIRGLGQLLEAVLGLAAVILIALLLLTSLLALASGIVRLVRACIRLASPRRRPQATKQIPTRGRPPR